MSLGPGVRLGSYEIVALIGAGGMGEVYRAHDDRLNRDVAIKTLPAAFAVDPDRLMRFKREAQVLASLNHPNIAAIYGLEESDGVSALVLELIEGPTLADRIASGPLPIDEALPIARQIADALESAHEQGIVHRDLKPANVKLRADGTVKVLDFGLAKALQPLTAETTDMPAAPTITSPALTQLGVILGTAAYMSPEQAKGRPADKRSDVWAFGAVLYEILSGQRAFKGEDISDVLAAVLRQDVDWAALPAALPASVHRLIARCLDRDPKRRLRDIGEARIALDGPFEQSATAPPATVPVTRRALPFALVALLSVLVTAAAAWYMIRPPAMSPKVVRLSFTLPNGQAFNQPNPGGSIALSPDGQQLVYAANDRLFLRSLASEDAHPIAGTEGYGSASLPAFSPEGRSVAFFATKDRSLRRIAVTGGVAVFICAIDPPYGISWSTNGVFVGQGAKGIVRVSPDGAPQVVIRVKEGEEAHGPQLLPDGQHVLFTLASGGDFDRWDRAQIVVQSVTSENRTTLIEGGSDARYDPTAGALVYVDGQSLLARPFDARQRTLTGGAVPLAGLVQRSAGRNTGAASFSVSGSSLAYVAGSVAIVSPTVTEFEVRLTDRNGAVEKLKLAPARYSSPRVSPDGTQLALGVQEGNQARIVVYELSGATQLQPLQLKGNNRYPVWSRDSQRLTFQSDVEGDQALFQIPVNGGAMERLTTPGPGEIHEPEEWSPTGETLLFSVTTKSRDTSLWTYSLPDREVARFSNVHSLYPTGARFSRDGRWVAYSSREGERARIYVEPFPPTGQRHELVISGPNVSAHKIGWSATSDELFYIPRAGEFEAVRFTTRPTFKFGDRRKAPRPFVNPGAPNMRTQYDITPKGTFVGLFVPGDIVTTMRPPATDISVILNWIEELKARR